MPAILLFAACSQGDRAPDDKAAAPVAGAPPGAAATPRGNAIAASRVMEKTDLIEFAYSYPRDAAAIPDLAQWLDADRAKQRDALIAAAQRDRDVATKEGFPYHAHSHLQTWEKVASTPRFLSLSSDIGTYMGGAHGMTGFDTLIWDRTRAMRLKPLDLFTSAAAFDAAIRDAFCDAIVRAKAAKGVAAQPEPDGVFAQCPPASAQTVWLGSSDGRYLDRVTIGIAPYEIGPYAEGSYRVNVPMSGALVRAVKPEYQRDFLPLN